MRLEKNVAEQKTEILGYVSKGSVMADRTGYRGLNRTASRSRKIFPSQGRMLLPGEKVCRTDDTCPLVSSSTTREVAGSQRECLGGTPGQRNRAS